MAGNEIACSSCTGVVKLPRMATAKLTRKAESIPEIRDNAAMFEMNPHASLAGLESVGESEPEEEIPSVIVKELDDIPSVVIEEDDNRGEPGSGEHSVVVTVEIPSSGQNGTSVENGGAVSSSSMVEERRPRKVPARKRPSPRKPLTKRDESVPEANHKKSAKNSRFFGICDIIASRQTVIM